MDIPQRLVFTVSEAAEEMRCHPRTVHDWIKQGKLRSYKIGNLRRITRDDLVAFIQSQPTTLPQPYPHQGASS